MKIPEYPEASSLASSDLLIVETTGGTKKVTESTLKSDMQDGMQEELTFDNAPTPNSTNPVTSDGTYAAIYAKVDKVDGKGLSTNDYTTEDKEKLSGLPTSSALNMILAAKQNVISGGTTGQILKKASSTTGDFTWGDEETGIPSGGTTGQVLTKKSSTDGDVDWESPAGTGDMLKSVYDTDDDGKVDSAENADTVNSHTVLTDVPADAVFTDTVYDDTEVRGLINGKISSTEKGANSGVATLDANGRVPSSQLPSYVDDVVEGYYNNLNDTFYKDISYTKPITPEESKIYISIDTNKEYRWSGSVYAPVNAGLALGETAGTAYEGNKGKANTDAISGIKNGATINSFGAVETALSGKADAVQGKGLSTNDYTDADKAIVSGVTSALADKVDKVSGKQLSTEDFTTAEKTKLDNLADIESIGAGLALDDQTGELSATGISITIDTEMSDTSINPVQNKVITGALDGKVDKVQGKGLSTEDYTTAEQTKLSGIESGANVNVQADWNEADSSADDFIKNKPTIPAAQVNSDWDAVSGVAQILNKPTLGTAAALNVASSGDASTTEVVKGDDSRLTDSRTASDVYSWAKAENKPTYTASEVGAVATTAVGANSGVASLDANGRVPSSQLPSYVDDVVEGYLYDGKFYEEVTHETEIPAEGDKIYVDIPSLKEYRWSGSAYSQINAGLALGETSGTAYEGNKGAANATAIAAIKDGTTIDSFSDVETALNGKADTSDIPDITGKADKVTSATNGNFAGLDSNGNLTDSGSKASDFLTQHQDITGKADKVSSPTSGNFAGLDSNGNLTDSGSKASDFLTSHQDITGKADKVTSATSGNFAGLDSNGNLTDSGSKASDFLTQHQDISGKQNKTLDTPLVVDGTTVTTVETALSEINTLAASGGAGTIGTHADVTAIINGTWDS